MPYNPKIRHNKNQKKFNFSARIQFYPNDYVPNKNHTSILKQYDRLISTLDLSFSLGSSTLFIDQAVYSVEFFTGVNLGLYDKS